MYNEDTYSDVRSTTADKARPADTKSTPSSPNGSNNTIGAEKEILLTGAALLKQPLSTVQLVVREGESHQSKLYAFCFVSPRYLHLVLLSSHR